MEHRRVVFDTNVYLSALLFGGNPAIALSYVYEDVVIAVISEPIFIEMRRVIVKKFPNSQFDYAQFEPFLRRTAMLVQLGEIKISACRDPKDNMIIETAVTGGADAIVTGDQDLLTLRSYENINIVTPAEFVKKTSS